MRIVARTVLIMLLACLVVTQALATEQVASEQGGGASVDQSPASKLAQESTVRQTQHIKNSSSFRAKDGFFWGITIPYNRISGDFGGDLVLVDEYQILFLPDVGRSVGMGLALGGRKGIGEWECSYSISVSDSKWMGNVHRAKYYSLSVDSRWFIMTKSRVQPFLLSGVGIVKLVIEDGSMPTDTVDFQIGDGRFWDIEWHPGAGVAYFLNPRVSLRLSALYRFVGFGDGQIEGVAGTIVPPRGIKANTLAFILGVAYVF